MKRQKEEVQINLSSAYTLTASYVRVNNLFCAIAKTSTYSVNAICSWSASNAGSVYVGIFINGIRKKMGYGSVGAISGSFIPEIPISLRKIKLKAGDIIEVKALGGGTIYAGVEDGSHSSLSITEEN